MTHGTAPPPGRRPGRVLRGLSLAEATVGGLLLALLGALMLLQAVQRYLPGGGWVWTGELARFSFVWLTFAMSGYLAARDGHISLKLVDIVAGPRLLRVVGAAANATVAIVCLNLAYEAWVLVTAGGEQTSPALGIPMNSFYVIPLAGLVLTAVRSTVAVFRPEPETDETDETDEMNELDEDDQAGPENREERPT
ncbi:TRAP transporter small permease [Actinomadura craniellae]|uniref:TRAP transporter small permease n=1 Tax=Actinomadura craniellae TaxID=2231787 RepID=A0A365H3E5_9ACTN|nr:TRAP transporter small permease [Actinomadura craniellae]RAY12733.1 TRAP transporter small permease [Actinomadura craniellae]